MAKLTFRLWVLIIVLVLSLLAISPSFQKGVIVKSVSINSSSYEAGLRGGDVIKSINGEVINTKEDYGRVINGIFENVANETKITIRTENKDIILFTDQIPEITVKDIPSTKVKAGLDLQGGARALIKPTENVASDQINDLVLVTRNRLNVFGLSDMAVRAVSDLEGNHFMVVEVAGATPSDLKELLEKQGKFEAKVGNVSVFTGGEEDIADVCRNDASCAGIRGCYPSDGGGYFCNFAFTVFLTESAAEKHAEVTKNLTLDDTGKYLSEKLYLYVDDIEEDELLIGAGLKGQVTTQIAIQGSGQGDTQEEAFNNAKSSMNKLQTILVTGSLPFSLEIVKLDTISPMLGNKFTYYLFLAGFAAIILVSLIIFISYKNFKISLAVLLTSFSEVFIILGFAALMKWNLDLPSIAGILIAIGTGVDQQIIIVDESKRKEDMSLIQKLKRALFIIAGAYFTSLVALIPLWWVGAGLLKGFVFTTIAGITIGVLITRPAFADIIKKIEK